MSHTQAKPATQWGTLWLVTTQLLDSTIPKSVNSSDVGHLLFEAPCGVPLAVVELGYEHNLRLEPPFERKRQHGYARFSWAAAKCP
jgi:hypothetical protein